MQNRSPYFARNGKIARYVNQTNDLMEQDLLQGQERVLDLCQVRETRVPINYPYGKHLPIPTKGVFPVKQLPPEESLHIMIQSFSTALDRELANDSLMSVEEHESCKAYIQSAALYLYRILDKLDYRKELE
jgi:hypothetical protein